MTYQSRRDPNPNAAAADDSRAWIEHLSEVECWRLLAGCPVGRIGVLVDSAPEIYPVNHLVDGETIVFRTSPGTKLAGLARSPAVCFQVDGTDPTERTGWSVLVKGRAEQLRQVADPDEWRRIDQLPLDYWDIGVKRHRIRIIPSEVTGRRIWRTTGTEASHRAKASHRLAHLPLDVPTPARRRGPMRLPVMDADPTAPARRPRRNHPCP